MDVGELHVTVNVNYAKIFLTKEQIKYIKVFHHLLFSQVVPVIKSFMVFDNYNYDNCFLIVPGKLYFIVLNVNNIKIKLFLII